ncbi:hypothetical protein C206_22224 [Pseudomonas putida TRO1]|uniref:Uncharacterized protein n=1 Tax=Pseudomonas putida TRO1 TaxID=1227924 RepID=A0AAD2ZSE1_PSEPU|nr:hypothetical protein C206_22224 [Pseudomonas putida TRO1]
MIVGDIRIRCTNSLNGYAILVTIVDGPDLWGLLATEVLVRSIKVRDWIEALYGFENTVAQPAIIGRQRTAQGCLVEWRACLSKIAFAPSNGSWSRFMFSLIPGGKIDSGEAQNAVHLQHITIEALSCHA